MLTSPARTLPQSTWDTVHQSLNEGGEVLQGLPRSSKDRQVIDDVDGERVRDRKRETERERDRERQTQTETDRESEREGEIYGERFRRNVEY